MIAVYTPEDLPNPLWRPLELDKIPAVVILESDLCACGQPSEFGGHGVKDNEVYDLYMCEKCYFKKRREG